MAMAGRHDGHAVEDSAVDIALLESTANGVTLNAGQAALVAAMATSGARLQLAIAPAGSGKTTAMRAVARAWTEGGGTVIGLAPSAAAAAALREQIDTNTDTLAKLTWSLEHGDLPQMTLSRDMARDRVSIHAGHAGARQDDVRPIRLDSIQRLMSVCGHDHTNGLIGKRELNHALSRDAVVGD